MKRIGIFYHSGAGSTKIVGEILKEKLSKMHDVEITRVDKYYDFKLLTKYDLLVFGFPVFGFEASTSIKDFINSIPKFNEEINCYIYSTLAFLSGNTIFKISRVLKQKNIIVAGFTEILSPASDGALLFPFSWKWVRSFRKKTPGKIENSIAEICEIITTPNITIKKPRKKLFWNLLEKIFINSILKQERNFINNLRIDPLKCTNCNHCVIICKRECIIKGEMQPTIKLDNCEFCLGCVHHCPYGAITFLKDCIDKPRLNEKFFKKQKEDLLKKIK